MLQNCYIGVIGVLQENYTIVRETLLGVQGVLYIGAKPKVLQRFYRSLNWCQRGSKGMQVVLQGCYKVDTLCYRGVTGELQ